MSDSSSGSDRESLKTRRSEKRRYVAGSSQFASFLEVGGKIVSICEQLCLNGQADLQTVRRV